MTDTNRFLLVFGLLTSLMGTSVGTAKLTTALYAIALGADPEQLGRLAAGQTVETLVMMAIRSAMQGFQETTMVASTPMLVPGGFLVRAVGLEQSVHNLTLVAAAPLGALAIAVMPIGWPDTTRQPWAGIPTSFRS